MKINWKIRLKNKAFWVAFIPALFVLVQVILAACGVEFNPEDITGKILAIIDALFLLLAIVGVINDPTVEGISDSWFSITKENPTPNYKEE